jgi:hypothetical protein
MPSMAADSPPFRVASVGDRAPCWLAAWAGGRARYGGHDVLLLVLERDDALTNIRLKI